MTIRTRNSVFSIAMAWQTLVLIYMATALIWGHNRLPAETTTAAIKGLAASVLALSGMIFVYLNFRRTASAEVFCFYIFLATFGHELLPVTLGIMSELRTPLYFIMMAHRIQIFLVMSGYFALFIAGLFSNHLPYTKLEIAMGICLLASFSLTFFIPVDPAVEIRQPVPYTEAALFLTGIRIFSVINMLLAAKKQETLLFIWCALGIILVLISRELLYIDSVYALPALVLFAAGIFIYIKKLHEYYQWM